MELDRQPHMEHRMNNQRNKPDTPDEAEAFCDDPIGAGLRQLLASVSEEPVPDEFLELLDSLDARRAKISETVNGDFPDDSTPQENV